MKVSASAHTWSKWARARAAAAARRARQAAAANARKAAAAKAAAAKAAAKAAAAKAKADRKKARKLAKRTTSDGYVAPKHLARTPGLMQQEWWRNKQLASLTGKCKDKCRGRCWLGGSIQVDKQCMLSDTAFDTYSKKLLDYRMDGKGRPTWRIWNSARNQLMGEVQCPCRDGTGMPVPKREALRRIAGQVAAMGIPDHVCKGKHGWKAVPEWKADWNIRVAVSTAVMLSCWERKCAAKEQEQSTTPAMIDLKEQLLAKLDEISAKAREHVTAPGMTGLRDKLAAKLGEISAKVRDGAVGSEMTGLREQLERELAAISIKVTGMLSHQYMRNAKSRELLCRLLRVKSIGRR